MKGIGIVKTALGAYRGIEENGITRFLGVPYAQPPVGEYRWKAPRPALAFDGVCDCTHNGNAACQLPGMVGIKELRASVQSEDCLYLNLWTPAQDPDEKLPVLFWIHGGAFLGGLSHETLYDGRVFAMRGIILVTVTYRLGPLGFLAHPELSAEDPNGVSGNYGILDLIEALRWVRANISAFGGDPDRITVQGQSAGGMSVCSLLASPLSRGLVAGGIIQSGGPRIDTEADLASAEANGLEFQKAAGAASLEELRAMDAQALLRVPTQPLKGMLPFRPVVDGYVIPEPTGQAFLKGHIADVPVMFGCNAGEGSLIPRGADPTEEVLAQSVSPENLPRFYALYGNDLPSALRLAGAEHGYANLEHFAAAMRKVRTAPVYMYYFREKTVIGDIANDPPHSAELPYVFHTLPGWGKNTISGIDQDMRFSAAASMLSEEINARWAAFAACGDPNVRGLVHWPPYTAENRAVLHLIAQGCFAGPHEAEDRLAFQRELTER